MKLKEDNIDYLKYNQLFLNYYLNTYYTLNLNSIPLFFTYLISESLFF